MNIVRPPSFRSRVGQVTPRCLTLRTYHRPKSQDMKTPCSIDSTFIGTANPNMTLNCKTLQVTSQSIQNAANHVMFQSFLFPASMSSDTATSGLRLSFLKQDWRSSMLRYTVTGENYKPQEVGIRVVFGFVCNSLGIQLEVQLVHEDGRFLQMLSMESHRSSCLNKWFPFFTWRHSTSLWAFQRQTLSRISSRAVRSKKGLIPLNDVVNYLVLFESYLRSK